MRKRLKRQKIKKIRKNIGVKRVLVNFGVTSYIKFVCGKEEVLLKTELKNLIYKM